MDVQFGIMKKSTCRLKRWKNQMNIFLMQCCGGSCARAPWGCCRLLHTFDFISSRPTVATVLVWGLLLLSSFCGLSRRCSRCFIIWSPPERNNGGGKTAKRLRGARKTGRLQKSEGFIIPHDVYRPPPQILLYSYMFGSQQAAGWRA